MKHTSDEVRESKSIDRGSASLRILQVIPFFARRHGGTVQAVYSLSTELVRMGHRVTVLTTDFELDYDLLKMAKDNRIEVVPIPCQLSIMGFLVTRSVKSWLRSNIRHYDVIHMHGFRSYQNSAVRDAAKKARVPYVLQARGSVLPFFEKRHLKMLYDVIWGRKILRDAHAVIALNRMEFGQCLEMGVNKERISTIPNGIDLSKFENLPDKLQSRTRFGLSCNDRVILSLGRIHRIKGLDLLARAFSRLSQEMDGIRLVIVGPDDGFLKDLNAIIDALDIRDKVLIAGALYGGEKIDAYVAADVYVLPSVFEAFPNSVLESWACGTPVIMTDRCGIADLVKGSGYVVRYDENDLKEALKDLLVDDGKRDEMGRLGKHFVETELGLPIIAEQIESLYLGVLDID